MKAEKTRKFSFDVMLECVPASKPEDEWMYRNYPVGERKVLHIDIEFSASGGFDYGNGYGMYVNVNGAEYQSYDIRYDDFDIEDARTYAEDYIRNQWSGLKGSWKAVEITGVEIKDKTPIQNYGLEDGILGRVFNDNEEIER